MTDVCISFLCSFLFSPYLGSCSSLSFSLSHSLPFHSQSLFIIPYLSFCLSHYLFIVSSLVVKIHATFSCILLSMYLFIFLYPSLSKSFPHSLLYLFSFFNSQHLFISHSSSPSETTKACYDTVKCLSGISLDGLKRLAWIIFCMKFDYSNFWGKMLRWNFCKEQKLLFNLLALSNLIKSFTS